MNFSNAFLTFFYQKTAEKPTLFPFPLEMHLLLVFVGAAFFSYRFYIQKRPNQILMAIAMIISLAIWLSESKALYYSLGAIELVLLAACFVTSLIFKAPEAEDNDENEKSDDEEKTEDEDENSGNDAAAEEETAETEED